MTTYEFELTTRFVGDHGAIGDGLFAAGCDDATPVFRRDVITLVFSRDANSFRDAVVSAVQQAETVDGVALVERVEPTEPDAVATAEAATVNAVLALRRSNSREQIEQLLDALQPA